MNVEMEMMMSGTASMALRTVFSAKSSVVLASWIIMTGLPPSSLVASNSALETSNESGFSKLVRISTSSPGLMPRQSLMATVAASLSLDIGTNLRDGGVTSLAAF